MPIVDSAGKSKSFTPLSTGRGPTSLRRPHRKSAGSGNAQTKLLCRPKRSNLKSPGRAQSVRRRPSLRSPPRLGSETSRWPPPRHRGSSSGTRLDELSPGSDAGLLRWRKQRHWQRSLPCIHTGNGATALSRASQNDEARLPPH